MCACAVEADEYSVIYGNPLRLFLLAFKAPVIGGIAPINLRATGAWRLLSFNEHTLRPSITLKGLALLMARNPEI